MDSTFSYRRMYGALALVLLAAAPAAAATVYRWTDEQGKVHYAETVPEKYRQSARPLAPDPAEPSPAQQREAQARAAEDKQRAEQIPAAAKRPRPVVAPASAASVPPALRPAQIPDDQTDCETWSRLYRASLDCFGPYRTARGGTKAEAYTRCNPVDAPPSRCRQTLPE